MLFVNDEIVDFEITPAPDFRSNPDTTQADQFFVKIATDLKIVTLLDDILEKIRVASLRHFRVELLNQWKAFFHIREFGQNSDLNLVACGYFRCVCHDLDIDAERENVESSRGFDELRLRWEDGTFGEVTEGLGDVDGA